MNKNYQSFIKTSIICSLFTFSSFTLKYPSMANGIEANMEYVKVFDTKGNYKKFSRLIMGTDHLLQSEWTNEKQKQLSEEQFNKLLDEAVKLGINIFDSSPIYVGGVESNFGKWLKSRNKNLTQNTFYYNKNLNPDRKVYTLSKGGFPFDLFNSKNLEAGTHSKELLNLLTTNNLLDKNPILLANKSIQLKNTVPPGTYASRLYGTKEQITYRISKELEHITPHFNRLTVLLMHRDDFDSLRFSKVKRSQTPVKNILQALGEPKIENQYEIMGLSNWETPRVNESIALVKKYPDLPKPLLNSPYFSLFEMSSGTIHSGGVQVNHKDMMNPNFQKGIKIMPYSPLGGFSILDQPEPRWKNAKKYAKEKYDKGDAYWQNVYHTIFTKQNEDRYYRVVDFTNKFNKQHKTNYSVDQMINAYALAHVRTDFLTIGAITIDQLRRTIGSLKLSHMLTKKNLDYLYSGK